MPQTTIDLLKQGISANQTDAFRRGNVVALPDTGSLVITGDVHGHRRNFERIVAFSDLANHPDRHLVLQEIIHGGPEDDAGGCLSYQLLFEAVRLKIEFPGQVHFVMGNHDTACISDNEVMKNGKEMNRSMGSALQREFRHASSEVILAIKQFLFSQPLAVRCANRTWISHSLPNERTIEAFNPDIFDRELQIGDCEKPGSAYLLTWGRRQKQPVLDKLAQMLDVDTFVAGHQPQPTGWKLMEENLLILACDHNHGCVVKLDLAKPYTASELAERIVPLASIY